ncbi:MFS transporter [Oharaeibacter diazotrophicus]|uniref:Putative MFS family arabinose efflux permease n=2 Tax=Oharaeibacter diazotrophicus TaxID=1920512 RepID=A0A4R6RBE9_9HYPH|nr:MFS transporter [Oharaeibacter diazotrophicus]TDP83354.1 putative MFS family arabinose efflux permease [Oharaeibacter diazotrophicus]BBE72187.1 putative MFS-type transporter YcaD [Pleomorphomonas sp. SM30]GLS78954.1 MFS transporter [Oharaeibacter diazotrophicus]
MAQTLAPLASLFLGISFLLCGNGLQTTLVPLRAAAEGFSAVEIGLIGSSYYLGFVVGCLATPYLIGRVGHIRTFAALVSAASAVALVHPIAVDVVVWTLARAVTGFALAGLYLIVESWLNDRATNENRGFVMSAYIITNFVTITGGQMLVTTAPIGGFTLFAVAAILIGIASIPVALSRAAQPAPVAVVRFDPVKLFRMAPVGIAGSFMIGVANGAFWSLGTLYATARGLSADGAAIFMSIAVIGGAVMQWPVGRLSDSRDRRIVLAGVMIAAAAAALVFALVPLSGVPLMAMALVFGMASLTGYSVAAAHAYDRADKSSYVEMAAGVLLANGLGSVIGPISASALIQHFGASALFFFMTATQLVLVVFIALRTAVRAGATDAEKTGFDVAATAPVGGPIAPEPQSRPAAPRPAAVLDDAA